MGIGRNIFELQKKINYQFKNIKLLDTALTHSSYANEQKSLGNNYLSNERLEFLGDSILETVISEHLYDNFQNQTEGELTKMRQYLVCEKTLAKIAESIELGSFIHLGRGEESSECRKRPKILCDAIEALFCAVYLDSRDSDFYKKVILKLFESEFENAVRMQKGDYKSALQELIEKDGESTLEYRVLEQVGPEHNKTFCVGVFVNNNLVGKGNSNSKKQAEMQAAKQALKLFGVTL